ncbi:MAG TPA: DinB family protein [Lapillicoccus sp.]|nr:DinB family protein [Lapillicoccus sp.]
MQFPEPTNPRDDRREVLLEYLDFYRAVVRGKVSGLTDEELHTSFVPSGWTPIELVNHLLHVERRWLRWAFEGEALEDPWDDARDGRWYVSPEQSVEVLLGALDAGGSRTRAIVLSHDLSDPGAPGEQWEGAAPPALERVLLHLIQEYARHAGHLDIVRELADGTVGEGSD